MNTRNFFKTDPVDRYMLLGAVLIGLSLFVAMVLA